jgi:hypothetical protein
VQQSTAETPAPLAPLQSANGGTQISDWLPPAVTVAAWPRPGIELPALQRGNRFDKMIKPLAGTVRLSGVVWYQVPHWTLTSAKGCKRYARRRCFDAFKLLAGATKLAGAHKLTCCGTQNGLSVLLISLHAHLLANPRGCQT